MKRGFAAVLSVGTALAVVLIIGIGIIVAFTAYDDKAKKPSAAPTSPTIEIVALGINGGLDQANLPGGFLFRSLVNVNTSAPLEYISMDAGTTMTGIVAAAASDDVEAALIGTSTSYTTVGSIYRNNIVSYLISHAHMDHTLGLLIGSPDDDSSQRKVVAGTPSTTAVLQNYLLNWEAWPNMGNGGVRPLNTYTIATLPPYAQVPLSRPNVNVTAFPLSHGNKGSRTEPYFSTAFLVGTESGYVLYFGDTGADSIEGNNLMAGVWASVAPYLRAGTLKAIFLECSYDDSRANNLLFGHLKPQLFMEEFGKFALIAGDTTLLAGFPVVVTHIKSEDIILDKTPTVELVRQQLIERNSLGLDLIFPHQGQWLYF